jgi:hypothetical protein
VAKESKEKNIDSITRSESLSGIKRYFGIESQEDENEFQRYIRRHTNLQQEDKSAKE